MMRAMLGLAVALSVMLSGVPAGATGGHGQGVWRQERSVFPRPHDPWRQWGRAQRGPEPHDPSFHHPGHRPPPVWVPGYWAWDGVRWIWVQGHWRW
jgi:hypothetical protein